MDLNLNHTNGFTFTESEDKQLAVLEYYLNHDYKGKIYQQISYKKDLGQNAQDE